MVRERPSDLFEDATTRTVAHSRRLVIAPAGRVVMPLAGIALAIGWAASGTGLLFGAFGLAIVVAALFLAARNTRGIELSLVRPAAHLVGESFFVELDVTLPRGRRVARDLLFSPVESRGKNLRPAGMLPETSAGEATRVSCAHRLLDRGRQREFRVVLHSSFPFGIFRSECRYTLPTEMLALPRLGTLADLGRLPVGPSDVLRRERISSPLAEDFYQLREWREGESLRHVHWKLSARRGRPILRDLKQSSEAPVRLLLLKGIASGRGKRRGRYPSFENAVSLAATIGEYFLRRGRRVSLSLVGEALDTYPELRGRAGLFRLLEALADVSAESVEPEHLRKILAAARAENAGAIVVLAGRRASRTDDSHRPSDARVIDVDAVDIDAVFQRGRGWGATPAVHPIEMGELP